MIAIIYATGRGHTKKLAEAVADGVGEGCILYDLADVDLQDSAFWQSLHACDGLIFGSPTYMGSASASMKAFMDQTGDFWEAQLWVDKVAAGFTIGTSFSGDKLSTLQQFAIFATQHGMIWIGQNQLTNNIVKDGLNECGSYLGLMATSLDDKTQMISKGDMETARLFGRRIRESCKRWGDV